MGLDLFDQISNASAICIPTNCSILDGVNPMGACAGEAARRWEELPNIYADLLSMCGAVPVILGHVNKQDTERFYSILDTGGVEGECAIVAYPTMYELGAPATYELVERSAALLVELTDANQWEDVYLAAPGIGVGGLAYESAFPLASVKSILENVFDDRFTVMRK